jgi:DNA-binding Xre family transcriptional regulator
MDKKVKEKLGPAFQKWLTDPSFEKELDAELKEFALSELLIEIMDENKQSVRRLADMAGISPSSLQDLRSGKSKDVKLKNFVNIIEACGYGIEIVKGEKRIPLHAS